MSNTGGGESALVKYLDTLRGDQSIRGFAKSKGIDHGAIHRWRMGGKPEIEALREIAVALNLTFAQILILAEYATPEDFDGLTVTPAQPPSLEDAIEHDPTLTPTMRDAFRGMLASMRELAPLDGGTGKSRKRTVRLP